LFVVLQIIRRNTKGLFGALRAMLAAPKVYLESGSCMGARFAIVKAEDHGKGIDWDGVESACGHFVDKVLLPEGITPPPESKIKNPRLEKFDTKVLVRTACALIAQTRMPMYRRILGLIDYEARYTDMLHELLAHFTSIQVVTRDTERYGAEARRMMRALGAPVLVSNNLSALSDCVLVLSPAPLLQAEATLSCPVLASGPLKLHTNSTVITGLRIPPGPDLLSGMPKNLDPHFFAGALYEFCGLEPDSFAAGKMLLNHRISTLPEAAGAIVSAAGIDSRILTS
jgi:hypothetical protein